MPLNRPTNASTIWVVEGDRILGHKLLLCCMFYMRRCSRQCPATPATLVEHLLSGASLAEAHSTHRVWSAAVQVVPRGRRLHGACPHSFHVAAVLLLRIMMPQGQACTLETPSTGRGCKPFTLHRWGTCNTQPRHTLASWDAWCQGVGGVPRHVASAKVGRQQGYATGHGLMVPAGCQAQRARAGHQRMQLPAKASHHPHAPPTSSYLHPCHPHTRHSCQPT